MLQGLKQRFEYATDPSAAKFDPLFVTATFLNPPYREILTDTQTKTTKQYLLELCKPPKSRLMIVSREAKKKQHTRPLSELFTCSTALKLANALAKPS